MPAFVGVKRGDAHETMHAGLRLQIAVGIGTGDGNRGAFDACLIARLKIQCLHLEPFLSAQRTYIRNSICAQSWDSVPPAPG